MKPAILVIDDEEAIRDIFESCLCDEGYYVTSACSYDEACKKILEKNFDLIFTDIVIGNETGVDVLRFVKERNLICPVVMITGYPEMDTLAESLRLGAFDYMMKPLNLKKLVQITERAMDYKFSIDEKERSNSNLEAIFRSVKDGIITVDRELRVVSINEVAGNILEHSGIINGKAFKYIFPECEFSNIIEVLKKTIKKKETFELRNVEYVCHGEKVKIVSFDISPLFGKDKGVSGAVIVIKDEPAVEMEYNKREERQFYNIIGKSEKMEKIYSLMERLADISTTVLITGESGTGKELIAEALHYNGTRKDNNLVKVNCSALSENLLESELFGHVKGAFTGAIKNKTGRFQMAHKGTIFLDEISEISPSIQVSLLRVLQEKEFEPVGDSSSVKVDVRIVASTNKDLLEKVKKGEFREELYYRLKVVEIKLPPLRERREDIPFLVDFFIKKFNKKLNKNISDISYDVKNLFMEYQWPGNIRELEHVIEYSFIFSSHNVITLNSLPPEFMKFTVKGSISDISGDEPMLIINALERSNWKKAKAARILGVDRKTVYRKIKKYKILKGG